MKKNVIIPLIMVAVFAVCGAIFWFSYFGHGGSHTRTAADQAAAPRHVTVKLKWLHQAQFAGMYTAKEKGFYAQAGLDVDLQPFSYQSPTIDAVANGKADFGVTGADELLLARAKGLPLKAIAVIYKINPICAYSLKEKNITKPQDFIGKTVGLEKGVDIENLYDVMMSRVGVDRAKIKEVAIGYDATELLAGKTDVSTGYVINEPQMAIENGKQVNIILMADYGADMYADVVVTRDDLIKNDPELVEKFLRATLNGWQYAIENEGEAVSYTLKYATDRTRAHETYMLKNSIPLINTGDTPIGYMETAKWQGVRDILVSQKLLAPDFDVSQAYTTAFIDKIRAQP